MTAIGVPAASRIELASRNVLQVPSVILPAAAAVASVATAGGG